MIEKVVKKKFPKISVNFNFMVFTISSQSEIPFVDLNSAIFEVVYVCVVKKYEHVYGYDNEK